jgi:serine/threonine-protein kinase
VAPGRYRIESIVRDGERSIVFRARDLRLDMQVWLKIFRPEGFGSAEEVARFTWQTRAESQVKSEHVNGILDVGIWAPGSPYIASEFLEGSDLATWLGHRGTLPESQAADFVIQACDALAEAHSLGIVHRDIKPANLFAVERLGIGASIRVLGWDISQTSGPFSTTPETAPSGTTEAPTFVGTPLYMPPEQWQGAPDLDERADIWAIGVTLCELVTGQVPFKGGSAIQIYSAIMAGQPRRLRERFPQLPPGLEAVILKCLQTERETRYQSVAELALTLTEFGSEQCKRLVDRICSMPQRSS